MQSTGGSSSKRFLAVRFPVSFAALWSCHVSPQQQAAAAQVGPVPLQRGSALGCTHLLLFRKLISAGAALCSAGTGRKGIFFPVDRAWEQKADLPVCLK